MRQSANSAQHKKKARIERALFSYRPGRTPRYAALQQNIPADTLAPATRDAGPAS
jgi:hypothetical protein